MSSVRDPQGDLTAPGAVSASVNARLAGERVEDLSQRTTTSSTFALPDGSWQSAMATGDVWVRRGGDGTRLDDWAAADSNLRANGDGSFSPVAQVGDVEIAGATTATGGSSVVASFTDPGSGAASQLTYPGDLPAPTVAGPRATYPDVQPGVDMVVEVTGSGLEQFFVVKDRPAVPAALELSTGLRTPGAQSTAARVQAGPDGARGGDVARVTSADGDVVASVATPLMWDHGADLQRANPVTEPFDPAAQPGLWAGTAQGQAQTQRAAAARGVAAAPVAADPAQVPVATGVAVTDHGRVAALNLTVPDAAGAGVAAAPGARTVAEMLADPDMLFPVVVDPTVDLSFTFDAFVESDFSSDQSASGELRVGTYDGTHVARSYLNVDAPPIKGKVVSKATLKLWQFWSYSCTATSWEVWSAYTASTDTRWTSQPGLGSKFSSSTDTRGHDAGCPAATSSVDVTSLVKAWSGDSGQGVRGMMLRATSETDPYGWKKFSSGNAATGKPTLTVTYNSYPNTPGSGGNLSYHTWYPDTSGTLYVKNVRPKLFQPVTDPDGGDVRATWTVHSGTTTAGTAFWSNMNGTMGASGGTSTATPSTSWAPLVDGATYTAEVWANDGTLLSTASRKLWTFIVDLTPPATPTVTASGYTNGQWRDTAPVSNTFTFKSTSTDVVKFQYKKDSDTAWTVLTPGTTSATLNWNPVSGAHKLQVQSIDKAGWPSATTSVFTFGAGGATLAGPGDGLKSTDLFTTTASGPPNPGGTVTATAYWRVSDGTTHAGDSTANGSAAASDGWTAITDSTQTIAASSSPAAYNMAWSAAAVADSLKKSRVPVRLALQVCFKYSDTGVTRCTWNSSKDSIKPTVTRVPHAFGDNFPTTDAGPGQVALWTGEYQQSTSDASVPAYSGDLSVSRTYSSLAGVSSDQPFGPGWDPSFDGDSSGIAGWEIDDSTGWDGTIALYTQEGDALTFRQPGTGHTAQKPGVYTAVDQDTKDDGGALVLAAAVAANPAANPPTPAIPAKLTYTDVIGTKTVFTLTDATAGTWVASSVTEAGTTSATTYQRDTSGRVTSIVGALPPGADGQPIKGVDGKTVDCTVTAPPAGCRRLNVEYATTTTATATTTGAIAGQVKSISYTAWDPDSGTNGAMTTTPVATYLYNADKTLASVTDPRSGLATSYDYQKDASKNLVLSSSKQPLLTTVTPSGQAAYTLTYDGAALDAHALTTVTRPDPAGGTAQLARVVYGINPATVTGGLPDMRLVDGDNTVGVGRWGQTVAPTYAAAVFGPDHKVDTSTPSGVAAADWPFADVQYIDANARVVDTASWSEGSWQFAATTYDDQLQGTATVPTFNIIKSLDNRGVAGILARGGASAMAQDELDSYATVTKYNDDDILSKAAAAGPNGSVPAGTVIAPAGTRVTDTWAPATDAGADQQTVRVHTHTEYDAGADTDAALNYGVNPATGLAWGLPTTVTTTQVADLDTTPEPGELVLSRSISGYDPIDGASQLDKTSGWVLGVPTVSTTVTDFVTNAGITTRTRFDSEGRTVETVGAKSNEKDAGTLLTTYYTAAGDASVPACKDPHPEWAGLVCQTAPADGSASVPTQGTTKYALWLAAAETTDTAGSTTRTTKTSFDPAGRPTLEKTAVTPGDTGSTAVDDTITHYNAAGLVDYTASQDSRTNPNAPVETGRISTEFDSWGRTTKYTDAAGEATDTTYVPSGQAGAGSVTTVSDSKSAVSYTYDASGNVTSQTTKAGTKTYTYAATWDGLGDLLTQTMPGGVAQSNSYNARDGQLLTLGYTGTAADGTHVPLLDWSLTSDAQGRTTHVSTNAGTGEASVGPSLDYGYDPAGRLVNVTDARPDVCQTRAYTFDDNGNRQSLTSGTYGSDCTTGQSLQVAKDWASAYDAADRLTAGAAVTATAWTADEADGTLVRTDASFGGGQYTYDDLGRATTMPAIDTPTNATTIGAGVAPTAGDVTIGYYDTDAAASITQDGVTTSFTLDPAGRRTVSTTVNASTSTMVTRRYGDGSDNPSWAQSVTGIDPASVSVYGSSIGGDLGFTVTDGAATLDLADPHGDTITTVAVPATGNATGIGAVACYDEYGNQATDLAAGAGVDGTATAADPGTKTTPNTGALAYGWLGAKQRATDLSGLILMGARLYNAVTGLFTSRDPVPGGNTTAYAYPQDPVNGFDLDGKTFKRFWKRHGSTILGGIKLGLSVAAVFGCAACAAITAVWGAVDFVRAKNNKDRFNAALDMVPVGGGVAAKGLRGLAYARQAAMRSKGMWKESRRWRTIGNTVMPRAERLGHNYDHVALGWSGAVYGWNTAKNYHPRKRGN
ncbi:hypothetical protein [Xylanimonas sp. McL0601]|uniref:hypothetical protein n=1 Tax=Xylanimonas sp. McL0601 TaxID=3414739 RepID=UPI003CEC9D76